MASRPRRSPASIASASLTAPGAIRGWRVTTPFLDVGTPRDYLDAAQRLGRADGDAVADRPRGARSIRRRASRGSVVWRGAHVGAGAVLEDCIVAGGAAVPAGLRARDAAIVPADAWPCRAIAPRFTTASRCFSSRLLRVSDSSLPAAVDGYLDRHRIVAPRVHAAHRRRVRSPVLSRPAAGRRAVRAGGPQRAVRLRDAAVREHGATVQRDAGAGAAHSRTRRRSRRARARGSRRRHAAGAPRRRARGEARRAVPPGGVVHRHVSASRARAGRPEVPAVRRRVRRDEAHVGDGLLHQALPRGLSRPRCSPAGSATRCAPSARRSSTSSPPSRACCAIATTTAAT